MDNQPFPSDVSEWTWDTLESLAESGQSENRYLEYKRHLEYPETDTNKSEREWKRDVEREFTAFANASGGILIFGMNDDGRPEPFEPPEHEISRTVYQIVQDTNPVVRTDVSAPLQTPSDDVDTVALAVRVHEATRKPVATSDSAYYVRINDNKHPMGREQIESLFIEADRRQQAVRQLEMEIDRFHEEYETAIRKRVLPNSPPPFHLIDIESLRQILRENNHLYTDKNLRGIMLGIFTQLSKIDSQERYYGRVVNGVTDTHHLDDIDQFNRTQQGELKEKARRLNELFEQLTQQAGLDAMAD